MGKVHGSLARAGKVKAATPKASLSREPNASFDRALPSEAVHQGPSF